MALFDILLMAYLCTCWLWPFLFVFCLVRAIRGPQPADTSRLSRGAAIVWAGVALNMITVVPIALLVCFIL